MRFMDGRLAFNQSISTDFGRDSSDAWLDRQTNEPNPQVTDEYPNGAYFRRTLMGNEEEVSPFASIPVAAYYVVYVFLRMDCDVVHSMSASCWLNRLCCGRWFKFEPVLTFLPFSLWGIHTQHANETTQDDGDDGASLFGQPVLINE